MLASASQIIQINMNTAVRPDEKVNRYKVVKNVDLKNI